MNKHTSTDDILDNALVSRNCYLTLVMIFERVEKLNSKSTKLLDARFGKIRKIRKAITYHNKAKALFSYVNDGRFLEDWNEFVTYREYKNFLTMSDDFFESFVKIIESEVE